MRGVHWYTCLAYIYTCKYVYIYIVILGFRFNVVLRWNMFPCVCLGVQRIYRLHGWRQDPLRGAGTDRFWGHWHPHVISVRRGRGEEQNCGFMFRRACFETEVSVHLTNNPSCSPGAGVGFQLITRNTPRLKLPLASFAFYLLFNCWEHLSCSRQSTSLHQSISYQCH